VGHSNGTGEGVFGDESDMRFGESTKGSKAISCRRVFRKKDSEQYKTRLVAKGYSQKEGIKYNEIFSPIVNHTSIGLLLTIVP